jgi:hypothetical protein
MEIRSVERLPWYCEGIRERTRRERVPDHVAAGARAALGAELQKSSPKVRAYLIRKRWLSITGRSGSKPRGSVLTPALYTR